MIATLILIAFAGAFKAVMDTLQFHYYNSIFRSSTTQYFWDSNISWKNKYTDSAQFKRKKIFRLIPVPVMFTDGWHLFQALFLNCFFLSIIFYQIRFNLIIDFIILRSVFGVTFYLFYNKILIKK